MSHIIPSSFSAYEMTDEEITQGSIFTSLQLQVLQNHLSVSAEKRIALEFDPKNPESFMQDDAALQAEIKILSYIIENSHAVLEILTQNNTTNSGE